MYRDGIENGLNIFRLGNTDIKTSFQINNRLKLLLSVGMNLSLSDATKALKSKITLTVTNGSNRNVRRLHIMCRIILPLAHHLTAFLENHYRDMESFRI